MRRIGIITYHNTTNFGAALQCYGLYKKISDLGGNVEVIDYHSKEIERKEIPDLMERPKGLFRNIKTSIYRMFLKKKFSAISSFMKENIKYSESVCRDNINKLNDNYDVFVSGSDILWDKKINGGDYTYFLDWVSEDKEKYSYATSVADNWDKDDELNIKQFLREYRNMATREQSGADWVARVTGKEKNAIVVCDPTMLITKDEWLQIARKSNLWSVLEKKKYVLTYFSNDDVVDLAQRYARENNLSVYEVNLTLRPLKGRKCLRLYSISDFLAAIYHADYVVTASYHGMLFSLYFEKQFRYLGRRPRTRMDHVANMLGIEFADGDLNSKRMIDYKDISLKIDRYRSEGIEFINNNIVRSNNL